MKDYSIKTSLLLGIALSGVVAASPALAQDSSANTKNDSNANGEIIVTAQRREQRLQDVPISITVFNQNQIDKRNIVTATDLATYTPSLSVNQHYGPEKSSFAIRGFVQDQATAPSVGVYFADVPMPRVQGGTTSGGNAPVGSFVDLQNVQVLKGPQGTLFGQNTTGGAVLLVPKKPTDKLEGYVEGSAGNYNMWRVTGVVNWPVTDTVRVRAMVDRNKRDGYMKNHSGVGPDAYNSLDYFAGRFSLVADLTPDLENYTIATYSHSFGNGYGARIEKCNPAATGLGALVGAMACAQLARQNARGDGPLDVEINVPDPYINLRQWSVINTTTWKATDTLTIKNIASFTRFTELSSFSLEGDNFFVPNTNIPIQLIWLKPALYGHNSAADDVSEELQFQGKTSNGSLTWQAGFYYNRSNPYGWSSGRTGTFLNCTDPQTLDCTNPLGFGMISDSRTRHTFDSKGIYAQGTYKFTDKLSLTAGARYTWDKIKAIGESTRDVFTANGIVRICNDQLRFPGVVVTDPSQCRMEFHNNSQKPTWTVDLEYKPTRDMLLYGKYSRGYREGGLNLTNIGLESWGPEKVDAYEIGAKASFRGRVHGYFDIAGFYNNFSNQQIFASLVAKPSSGLTGGAAIVNAGKSRIQGFEVDASATVFDSLNFHLGYTYLDTRLKRIDLPTLPPNSPFDKIISSATPGSQLALSPKNRLTLTGTYTLPLDASIGKVSVGATYIHTDSQVATLGTIPQFQRLPATDLVNLNVNWNSVMGSPVDASFFVTNLTNQIYPVSVSQAWYSFGFESRLYGPPRMWGFRLRYSFGQ